MRWKIDFKPKHKEYDKRVIEKFALIPRLLGDKYIVWLEKYYVEQTYYFWSIRGEWCNSKTWSRKTEQRNLLKVIDGSN